MSTSMDTPFSKWLNDQMKIRNWTQADLARASRLTRQAIANYVDGRTPSYEAINAFAHVFKVSPETLFGIANGTASKSEDPWVVEMSHKLRLIPPALRPTAGKLIESMAEGEEATTGRKTKSRTKPVAS